ncbi:cache domain-containing protein [Schlegelella sp. S2-27]|uniref:Cache domain-containing protein n=1 Tax=Caldimonas mangrovi TaxID=2944811 RepID=A0ABT0YVR7_9BURK|nr:cache domain-containing protein [Caldimonas mangrovi]MCM5682397.1 cache domain-containing protein [Caldimonas mangrovi]
MNRKHFLSLVATATAVLSMSAFAQERGSRDEAKALVDKAVAHAKQVGTEQAFKDFMTDRPTWTHKDLYVFATSFEGVMLANGANERLVGKNLMELKDQNGKAFVKEYLAAAQSKGSAWTDYDWPNPTTKKVEQKTSYVRRLDGAPAVVGVGVYR